MQEQESGHRADHKWRPPSLAVEREHARHSIAVTGQKPLKIRLRGKGCADTAPRRIPGKQSIPGKQTTNHSTSTGGTSAAAVAPHLEQDIGGVEVTVEDALAVQVPHSLRDARRHMHKWQPPSLEPSTRWGPQSPLHNGGAQAAPVTVLLHSNDGCVHATHLFAEKTYTSVTSQVQAPDAQELKESSQTISMAQLATEE